MKRAVLVAIVLFVTAAPVGAHSSSYCGHGSSGIYTITDFVNSHKHWFYPNPGGAYWKHHHRYDHYTIDNTNRHTVSHRTCPKH